MEKVTVKFGYEILLLEDLLEDILEFTVVSFQDSVLSAHVKRPFLHDSVLETAVSKIFDGLNKIGYQSFTRYAELKNNWLASTREYFPVHHRRDKIFYRSVKVGTI